MPSNQFSDGVSLIELMVVVGIVAILSLVALPAYNNHAAKARRVDARAALIGLSIAMERYYTERSPSTYIGAQTGSSGIYSDKAPLDSTPKFYNLTVKTATASAFTLWASPTGGHSGDDCGIYTLSNTGARGLSGSSKSSAECWE